MKDERLDIILTVLKKMKITQPRSKFIESLYIQYCERGSLSKGQLEGLHDMASKSAGINPSHLATLQAIILKKKSFHRSPRVKEIKLTPPDNSLVLLSEILTRYPGHKRAIFLSEKLRCGNALDATEKADVSRIHGILLKKDNN